MHVVATDGHDVQRARAGPRWETPRPRARPARSLRAQSADERDVAADRDRKSREPQRVRTRRIEEVRPPASPARDRALLGDRGVGDEAAEVAHSEQLICERQRDHRGDERGSIARSVDARLADERDDQEEGAEEHELGAYQPAQTEDHQLETAQPARLGTGPVGEDRQAPALPREREAGLEPARLEHPRRKQRDEHQQPERNEHRVRPRASRQRARTDHGEPESGTRQAEAEPDREPLEPDRRDDVGDRQDGDPQRAREGLDPLARVEDRAVAARDLAHDAEVDEAVVRDPPVGPTRAEEERERHRDEARLQTHSALATRTATSAARPASRPASWVTHHLLVRRMPHRNLDADRPPAPGGQFGWR